METLKAISTFMPRINQLEYNVHVYIDLFEAISDAMTRLCSIVDSKADHKLLALELIKNFLDFEKIARTFDDFFCIEENAKLEINKMIARAMAREVGN